MLVRDVMQTALVTIGPDTTLPEAIHLAARRGIELRDAAAPLDEPRASALAGPAAGSPRPSAPEVTR